MPTKRYSAYWGDSFNLPGAGPTVAVGHPDGLFCVSSSRNIGDTLELYIDPDCGLKTRTWQEAEAKLRVMVQAVREVKQEMGLVDPP